MSKDYPRRKTPQDRPFIYREPDVALLAGEFDNPGCSEDCFDCLRRGPVTFAGEPAALRFAITFHSDDDLWANFNGDHILTWSVADGYWISDEIEFECPGGSGNSTFEFQLYSIESPDSIEPGMMQLAIEQTGGDPCPEFFAIFWENVYRFEGLCSNIFRASYTIQGNTKAHLAMYDTSQSCTLCVEPMLGTTSVDFSCAGPCDDEDPEEWPTAELPLYIGFPLTALTGDLVSDDCCDFENHSLFGLEGFGLLENGVPVGGDNCLWGQTSAAQQCLDGMGRRVETRFGMNLHCVDGDNFYLRLIVSLEWIQAPSTSLGEQTWVYESETFPGEAAADFMLSFDVDLVSNTGDALCLDPPASINLFAV